MHLKQEKDFEMINKALLYAYNCHLGQIRKGTSFPYIIHPLEAMIIASRMTTDDDIICAALLHDVMEDCDVTSIELSNLFNVRIAELVLCVTDKNIYPWKKRKEVLLETVNNSSNDVKIVFLADKLSNLRSIHHDILETGDCVWKKFPNRNINDLAWYYKEVTNVLNSLSKYDEFSELKHLVELIFE